MTSTQKFCQYCGAVLSPTMRFCESCGQPVPGSQPAPSDATMVSPAPLDYSRASEPPAEQEPESAPTLLHSPPVVPPPVRTPPPPRTPPYPPYSPPPPPAAPPKTGKRPWWVFLIVALVIVCCLCLVAGAAGYYFYVLPSRQVSQEELPVELPVQVETQPAEETVEVTVQIPVVEAGSGADEPTETPEAIEPPPAATETPTTSYHGVSFSFEPQVASFAEGELLPEASGADIPPWEIAPRHLQFSFSDYPLQDTFHQPRIWVYPVEEYARLSENVPAIVGDLRRMLTDRTMIIPENGIPFLPTWNAAQVMQTYINYLDFKNGSGIRFLTQYGQDVYPINNQALFYTFQGLTEDGRYYIAAIFPISNPVLPDPDTIELNDEFYNRYLEYIDETKALLDSQPTSTFTPDVTLLDELIYSLEVNPDF